MLCSAIFAGLSFRTAHTLKAQARQSGREAQQFARDTEKKRATFDTLMRNHWDKDYLEARREFRKIVGNSGTQGILQLVDGKLSPEQVEKRKNLSAILNDYELTALGIHQDILKYGDSLLNTLIVNYA